MVRYPNDETGVFQCVSHSFESLAKNSTAHRMYEPVGIKWKLPYVLPDVYGIFNLSFLQIFPFEYVLAKLTMSIFC